MEIWPGDGHENAMSIFSNVHESHADFMPVFLNCHIRMWELMAPMTINNIADDKHRIIKAHGGINGRFTVN